MSEKSLCVFDIMLWICTGRNEPWQFQKENCDFAQKMPGRNRCLFVCDDGRCYSIKAHDCAIQEGK